MKRNKPYPGQSGKTYGGKIRKMTPINDDIIVMEVTDHISAFEHVFKQMIPLKGIFLNLIAAHNMKMTSDIVPNCLMGVPHPRVSIMEKAEPFKVEMVIRGYLVGSAWRLYQTGERTICGVTIPDGMVENQKFPEPIITPTTKEKRKGRHDEIISKEEIISSDLVSKEDYEQMEKYTYALFRRGSELAARNGLILVETKYEFGKTKDGAVILIDEIHTPDSSRYFYADEYGERMATGKPQKQLSKEFVREWLMQRDFMGRKGDIVPVFPPEFIKEVTARYLELYKQMGLDVDDLPEIGHEPDVYKAVVTGLEEIFS